MNYMDLSIKKQEGSYMYFEFEAVKCVFSWGQIGLSHDKQRVLKIYSNLNPNGA